MVLYHFLKDLTDVYGLFKPLTMVAIAIITSIISELAYYKFIMKKTEYKAFLEQSYSMLPGLFLALTLPLNTPLSIVIVGSFIASIIGKMIFGGFGNNIFNPALIGRLFVMSAYGINIINSGGYLNAYEVDTIAKATPLSNVSVINGIGTYDTLVKPFGSLWDFFIGSIPGSLGETSALLIIIAFLYLTITKVIKWTIPITYVLTVFVMDIFDR
jgi:Na+-translocating ferredoxin:NAD+ oxidoreductase subunit D